jgi:4a-hydroxytetrahydrobiopterin dehydratase
MPLLSDDEVEQRLGRLEGWSREGDALTREFKLKDFVGSIDFVNRMVEPAEEMNHHPDLSISWNKVTVSLSTHSEGGITENDFELARKIDSLA